MKNDKEIVGTLLGFDEFVSILYLNKLNYFVIFCSRLNTYGTDC